MVLLLLHIFFQIILEMLPISSSSFVTLALGQQSSESVQLLLHTFTVLVIGLYFFKPWWRYLRDFLKLKKEAVVLVLSVIGADIVTTFCYFLWKVVGVNWVPLWCGLVVTGLLLVSLSWIPRPRSSTRSLNDGDSRSSFLILGLIQGIALLPGISRLGSTYVIARWLGYVPEKAFEYSWLIAWPLLVAGSAKGWWQLHQVGQLGQLLNWPVMLAMLSATVLSWYVLHWCAQLVTNEKVYQFAWWVFATAVFAFLFR